LKHSKNADGVEATCSRRRQLQAGIGTRRLFGAPAATTRRAVNREKLLDLHEAGLSLGMLEKLNRAILIYNRGDMVRATSAGQLSIPHEFMRDTTRWVEPWSGYHMLALALCALGTAGFAGSFERTAAQS
jgi:hypothetical protein